MDRGKRTVIVLAVALLAALGASYAAYVGMQRVADRAAASQFAPVVVAARPVPVGTELTADDVKVIDWPTATLVEGAVQATDQAVGRAAVVALSTNEPVTDVKLGARGSGAGLSPAIPPGMRAISIRVNEVVGVGGFIVPGSRVDVLVTMDNGNDDAASFAHVVVSNAQVLTAGSRAAQEKAEKEGQPFEANVVTLLVSPEDAEKVALAQNKGQVTLTMRNPLDSAPSPTDSLKLAELLGRPAAPIVAPPAAPRASRPRPRPEPVVATPVVAPKVYTVETIRGAKRTEETVK